MEMCSCSEYMRGNMWEKVMFVLLVIYALATNVSVGVTSVCTVLMAMTVIVQKVKTGNIPSMDASLKKVFLIYFLLQMVIAVFSWNPADSIHEVISTMTRIIPVYFAMAYIRLEKQIVLICLALFTSLFLSDCVGAYQLSQNWLLRISAASDNPNMYAVHIIMTLPLLYIVFRHNGSGSYARSYVAFISVFSTIMLLVARSRSSWVALICMLFVLVYLDKENRKLLFKFAGCFMMALIVLGILMPEFVDRIASITDLGNKSNSDRIIMWKASFAMFLDYPLTGVGQEQWQQACYGPYNDLAPVFQYQFTHPHNNIIQQMAQGGILGLISYCMLHAIFLCKLFKMAAENKNNMIQHCGIAGLLIWIGMQATGVFDVNLDKIVIMREYWFIMGVMLSAVRLEQN